MGPALTQAQIQAFIQDGFVRVDQAFPRELADEGRAILWADTEFSPHNTATWLQPVIRLGNYSQTPFRQAVNSPRLVSAYDQLVGVGRWLPRTSLGTFPIRFPSPDDPGDAGWHIDMSFGTDSPNFMDWRANVTSTGRALLMLFLFSDVGPDDAPTRIRVGSHLTMAQLLAPAGEAGLSLRELAANNFDETAHCPEVTAVGDAGTVYLCHPFLVHGAQAHRGTRPRFMAQPPLLPSQPFQLDRPDGSYSPVEQAIRLGISGAVT
ncbi:phytanoyl-CoA dioxygenase family protein [Spirosoma sp. KUDC1026]|uniref:phytanoyl-CoA dioxygenase family protein n=1 Tax=Spirosoma sp. KUDC1026 TaxID=2745947 RepID=UPI00159BB6A3|nr:phytanoyl-CoA dioxygenase family protein [Spirosoma sp. KUDC1026]QKZ15588.1 phytanoyl-CoA dioxygenase family protein [Spirosoma sp. KUDC1026]